jgi:hypothetical protein
VTSPLYLSFSLALYVCGCGRERVVTALASRIFACWALLATIVGLHTAADINNKTLYRLTLFTFYLALGFYGFETCIAKTMPFLPAFLPAVVIACNFSLPLSPLPSLSFSFSPYLRRKNVTNRNRLVCCFCGGM